MRLTASDCPIRAAQTDDAGAIAEIYNHYIANSVATFDTDAIEAEEMARRMAETLDAGLPWLVIEHNGGIAGYACASKWKGRCAYRFSVETSIYLGSTATHRGLGSLLYSALLDTLRAGSMRSAIGGITLPNPASVTLHEKFGFQKVAHFREVGFKFDQWLDVGYWQLRL